MMDLNNENWLILGVICVLIVGLFIYLNKEETFQLGLSLQHTDCLWKDKRFLVLCNPVGGKRQGELIVKTVVRPLCAANSISIDVIYTERAKHAFEIATSTDFSCYAGVLLVSGDGLIHEFVNGLAARVRTTHMDSKEKQREKKNKKKEKKGEKKREKEEEEEEDFVSFLSSFPPIGVLPGGTCNGVCTTLHSPDPVAAMHAILRGKATAVDLFHVMSPGMLTTSDDKREEEEEEKVVINAWDVHYFSWAIFADAGDIIERKVRFLPKLFREPVAAVLLIAQKKTYHGTLYLQPSQAALDMSAASRQELLYNDPLALPLATEEPYASQGYRVISGSFVLLCGANMPAASFDVQLAPSSRANDQSIDLVFMRGDVSRFQLISTFLSLDSGSHMKSDYVYAYKVKNFSLLPASGIIDISGELYPNPNCSTSLLGEDHPSSSSSGGGGGGGEQRQKDITVSVHPRAISFIF